MVRLVLHPGSVVSQDGDMKYVGVGALTRLYNARMTKGTTVIVITGTPQDHGYIERPDDIHLFPLRSGRYEALKYDKHGQASFSADRDNQSIA